MAPSWYTMEFGWNVNTLVASIYGLIALCGLFVVLPASLKKKPKHHWTLHFFRDYWLLDGWGFITMLILPHLYLYTNLLDRFNYSMPTAVRLIVLPIFVFGGFILSFVCVYTLGDNYSSCVAVRVQHELVEIGVYQYVRHPLYTALAILGLFAPIVFPNLLAGCLFWLEPFYAWIVRVPREERMLKEKLGEVYVDYMQRTGRFCPWL